MEIHKFCVSVSKPRRPPHRGRCRAAASCLLPAAGKGAQPGWHMAGTDSLDLNSGEKSWGRGGALSWRMSRTAATADTRPRMDDLERHNPELWDGRKHRRTHLSPDGTCATPFEKCSNTE